MKVLTLAARKGGTGKTTLAASLAVTAAQDGETVAIIDMDDQSSLADWHARRVAQDEVPAVTVHYRQDDRESVHNRLQRIRDYGGISLVVIDTPGRFDETTETALTAADLTLLPVRPGILDVQAVQATAQAVAGFGRPYAFVLSQVQNVAQGRAVDVARALQPLGPLYPAWVSLRADHLDAMTLGLGVTEWRRTGAAADEIRALWQWTKDLLRSE